MKPFDLTGFLKMGGGLGDTFDGSNNRKFPGVAKPIRNAGEDESCGPDCTVARAMEISANTVFYDMVLNKVKPSGVAKAAEQAGVRTKDNGGNATLFTGDNNISLGGGETAVSPRDMAAAYASFAGGGTYHEQHFVAKLTNGQDEVEFDENNIKSNPAFDDDAAKSQQIAGNVTEALKPVISHSNLKCPTGHECAGKTGTQQYAPQGRATRRPTATSTRRPGWWATPRRCPRRCGSAATATSRCTTRRASRSTAPRSPVRRGRSS